MTINKQGSALLLALGVMVVLISFGVNIFMSLSHDYLHAHKVTNRRQAFYIAEAGIEKTILTLRHDLTDDATTPNLADGQIGPYQIGPDTVNFFNIPFPVNTLNGGTYEVDVKNIIHGKYEMWVRSTGRFQDEAETLLVYVRALDTSIWNNAIFGGRGGGHNVIHGNVNVSGSIHILGDGLTDEDYAIRAFGNTILCSNNYRKLPEIFLEKIPELETTMFNGIPVETLNAELRVKKGKVGLSGKAAIGEPNVEGNFVKETADGAYVTDGWGGNQGASQVYSDNGTDYAYDLGDMLTFPRLSAPYGEGTYLDYLKENALVLTTELQDITPQSTFLYENNNGRIQMDGAGHLTIDGVIYVDGNNGLQMHSQTGASTIVYSGKGSLVVTGDVKIGTSLITEGARSFPENNLGIMTPDKIIFQESQTDVMGVFYAEDEIAVTKQTNVIGAIASDHFDLGQQVPSVFHVPAIVNNLPPRMIDLPDRWKMKVLLWQRL